MGKAEYYKSSCGNLWKLDDDNGVQRLRHVDLHTHQWSNSILGVNEILRIPGVSKCHESEAKLMYPAAFGLVENVQEKLIVESFNDWGVGMPATLKLHEFGSQLWHAFGQPAFLVGSAARSKTWRDVDVRLILNDDIYDRLGLGNPKDAPDNGRWAAFALAFSALGREMTGLPIDFQIQQITYANEKYHPKEHPRRAIGFVALRDADAVSTIDVFHREWKAKQ